MEESGCEILNMKTLIVTLEYPPQIGGIASYVYNFLRHVPNEDFVLCAPRAPGEREFDVANPWKTYRRDQFGPVWPHWLRLFPQIVSISKMERIDELHIHQVLPGGYIGLLMLKIFHIPYTIFLHGSDVSAGTKTRWKEMWFSLILRNAKKVVVNSKFLERRVKSKVDDLKDFSIVYPCPGENFLQIVESSELENLRTKLALHGKKVVLTVSRMVDGKGYPHIIRVLNEVSREIPNVVWLFIGDGPKRESILNLVQKNYLQNVVRFLGAVPNDQLPPYFQVADLFVLLCHADEEAAESWGSVFLEAAASGLPVVAGRVGGVEEAVDHLHTGLVVDVYQGRNVVNSIIELLRDDSLASKLGKAGKERVEREFTWTKQIEKIG